MSVTYEGTRTGSLPLVAAKIDQKMLAAARAKSTETGATLASVVRTAMEALLREGPDGPTARDLLRYMAAEREYGRYRHVARATTNFRVPAETRAEWQVALDHIGARQTDMIRFALSRWLVGDSPRAWAGLWNPRLSRVGQRKKSVLAGRPGGDTH